jgi:hypothetical protein
MPKLEDCVIRFEDPNSTMVRVENAPEGVGANIVFPSVEPEHARGAALSAVRKFDISKYEKELGVGTINPNLSSEYYDNLIKQKSQARMEDAGSVILIMIVVIICLISVIRAVKKSN